MLRWRWKILVELCYNWSIRCSHFPIHLDIPCISSHPCLLFDTDHLCNFCTAHLVCCRTFQFHTVRKKSTKWKWAREKIKVAGGIGERRRERIISTVVKKCNRHRKKQNSPIDILNFLGQMSIQSDTQHTWCCPWLNYDTGRLHIAYSHHQLQFLLRRFHISGIWHFLLLTFRLEDIFYTNVDQWHQ